MDKSREIKELKERLSILESKYAQSCQAAEKYKSALAKSRRKNLHLVENLSAGIARSTPGKNGKFIEVNQAMVDILGFSRAELFAMNLYNCYADPDQGAANEAEIAEKGRIREQELVLINRKGKPVVVSYTAKSVPNRNGQPLFVDEILYDITCRKKNEEELQKTEKLKSIGALAGGIAHNFNNIMTGLYGNITLARMELGQGSPAISYLDKAEASMKEAVKLTRQLLTFAKGGDPIKETMDLHPFMKDIAEFNLSGSPVKLVLSAPEDLWQIHADKSQIGQVISNMVMNAREAMPDGGLLTITMENTRFLKDNLLTIQKRPHVRITMADQGTGIHQKDLERIFDPYFTTRKNRDGMGLSVCYSIIKKHNGHIHAASQVGRGTRMTIHLPAVPPQIQKDAPMEANTPLSERPAKILAMDDEEHIRNIVLKMIEKLGHTVTLASEGQEAVDQYRRAMEADAAFDLVIMDLTVPGGMGGLEASKQILALDPEACIVVSSGYSNGPVMSDHETYGLAGIIPKPFRFAELERTVTQFVGSAAPPS